MPMLTDNHYNVNFNAFQALEPMIRVAAMCMPHVIHAIVHFSYTLFSVVGMHFTANERQALCKLG